MLAASEPIQRPPGAKLLALDGAGAITHHARSSFIDLLRPGDLVVANDAATLPASLFGFHESGGASIEVRLASRSSLQPDDANDFFSVIFGEGDFRTRTEDRAAPPRISAGDRLLLGPLTATVARLVNHPRLVALHFHGSPDAIWEGLARHGRPIQYAHVPAALSLWDVWTPVAAQPVAFEPPSAGFLLDWRLLRLMSERGVQFATITHAAGISSTGDSELDALLPLDEAYRISDSAASAIHHTGAAGGRVIAVGTTVVRALEDSARDGSGVQPGERVAMQRIGPTTSLQVVDAIISGTHEPGSSHYELLRAFASDAALQRVDAELNRAGYRTHEFGDSVFVERSHLCNALTLRSRARQQAVA